jgi:adenylate kinase family enzyme
MPKLIVLISGRVGAGKTTLSDGLRRQYNATVLKTKEVLKSLAVKRLKRELPPARKSLQEFGTQLDKDTKGRWVLTALNKHVADARVGEEDVVLVDAVRILEQIKAIRRVYQFAVRHVHLEASPKALTERYKTRGDAGVKELSTYSEVGQDSTESRVASLRDSADFLVHRS